MDSVRSRWNDAIFCIFEWRGDFSGKLRIKLDAEYWHKRHAHSNAMEATDWTTFRIDCAAAAPIMCCRIWLTNCCHHLHKQFNLLLYLHRFRRVIIILHGKKGDGFLVASINTINYSRRAHGFHILFHLFPLIAMNTF